MILDFLVPRISFTPVLLKITLDLYRDSPEGPLKVLSNVFKICSLGTVLGVVVTGRFLGTVGGSGQIQTSCLIFYKRILLQINVK